MFNRSVSQSVSRVDCQKCKDGQTTPTPQTNEPPSPTTHLAEVTGVVLVHQDAVVVLPTGVTAATGVLAVLPDAAVARAYVPALLAVLRESGGLSFCGRQVAVMGWVCRSVQRQGWMIQAGMHPSTSHQGAPSSPTPSTSPRTMAEFVRAGGEKRL